MSSSEANAAQIEHWNSEAAMHWVTDRQGHDQMLAPFATALLEAATLTPDNRILDIGCGTGPTTCEAARIASRGHARGLDISRPLIEAARSRAAELGITNVSFDLGDAQTDSFAPEVDVVMSRFGVMFFDDPAAAFANLRTALDQSGRLVFICWQDLFVNEWMAVPGLAAAQHVPIPEPGPPGAPGPFSLGDGDRVRELLSSAGYSKVTIDPFETSILLPGGSLEGAANFLQSTGMARALFADAPPDAVERAIVGVKSALESYVTSEGVRLGAATWIVSATG